MPTVYYSGVETQTTTEDDTMKATQTALDTETIAFAVGEALNMPAPEDTEYGYMKAFFAMRDALQCVQQKLTEAGIRNPFDAS